MDRVHIFNYMCALLLILTFKEMISDVRRDRECFADGTFLEISTYNQEWDKESLKELREKHNIVFMSEGDSVTPILVENGIIHIGIEDDGTLFFMHDGISIGANWIDSLIAELKEAKNLINKNKK